MNYEVYLIPNYGNDDIIVGTIKSMEITSGPIEPSGFIGCDVPVIIKIWCTEQQKIDLEEILKEKATDIFDIYQRCKHCGSISHTNETS